MRIALLAVFVFLFGCEANEEPLKVVEYHTATNRGDDACIVTVENGDKTLVGQHDGICGASVFVEIGDVAIHEEGQDQFRVREYPYTILEASAR